jgi:hypothetical protein
MFKLCLWSAVILSLLHAAASSRLTSTVLPVGLKDNRAPDHHELLRRQGYTTAAIDDSVESLPGWSGSLGFNLFSGYEGSNMHDPVTP